MEQLRKFTIDHGYTLPDNWSVKSVKRVDGATRDQVDHYYFTPGGRRFRSKVEVLKFLDQYENWHVYLNQFSFRNFKLKCL